MNRRFLGALPALLVVVGLSVASLVGLLSRSFRPGALLGGEPSLDAWRQVFGDGAFWSALWFTTHTALVATVVSLLVGVPLGIALRRAGALGRGLVLLMLPVPHLVVASVAVSWLGPGRLLDRLVGELPVIGDRWGTGIVLVYVMKEIPFIAVLTALVFDPATSRLEEVAASLGATRWHRWRFIIFPRLAVPVALGALVIAAFVTGSTEVALVVGPLQPDVLTVHAITITRINGPIARAESAVVFLVAAMVVLALATIGLALAARLARAGER